MASEIDRYIRKQSELEKLAKASTALSDLVSKFETEGAFHRLRDQAQRASEIFADPNIQSAFALAKSQGTLGVLEYERSARMERLFNIATDDLASANMRRTIEQLSIALTGSQYDLVQKLSLSKLASDLSYGALSSIPTLKYPGLAELRTAAEDFYREFRRPEMEETVRLARRATSVFDQSRVQGLIAGIDGPWARIGNELASTIALSNLAALNRAVSGGHPYGNSATKLLRDELGDWRKAPTLPNEILDPTVRTSYYLERGYDQSLTDFPADVADQLLSIVSGDCIESGDEAELRSDRAFGVLSRFERRIRDFIEVRLLAAFGEGWENSQIPPDILNDWREKYQRDLDMRSNPRPRLIDYSDFSHYPKIVLRKDNWRVAFEPVFRRKSDFEESLIRLAPVRIATMHSVLVTIDDALMLELETKRVIGAISRFG